MKYLLKFIFSFLRSGVEAKRGVEFCHSTRNASRIRQEVGTECLNTSFPLPTLLRAGYSVKLIYFLIFLYILLSISIYIHLRSGKNKKQDRVALDSAIQLLNTQFLKNDKL